MIFDQTAKVGRAVPSAPGRACSALDTNIRKSVIFAQIFCANTEERRAGTARPTRLGFGSAGLRTAHTTTAMKYPGWARWTWPNSPHPWCTTSRYKNNSAWNAWFCVDAATLPFTTRSLRNLSTSNQPPSDLRLPLPSPSRISALSAINHKLSTISRLAPLLFQ